MQIYVWKLNWILCEIINFIEESPKILRNSWTNHSILVLPSDLKSADSP